MSTQVRSRDGGDPRYYDPNRDLAHTFPRVAKAVAMLLERECWPALNAYLAAHDLTEEDLSQACAAYTRYVVYAAGPEGRPAESHVDCLRRAGADQVLSPATVAYCAALGSVMLGEYFAARRNAFLGPDTLAYPDGPMAPSVSLVRLAALPAWRRGLTRSWWRVRGWLRRLRGGTA